MVSNHIEVDVEVDMSQPVSRRHDDFPGNLGMAAAKLWTHFRGSLADDFTDLGLVRYFLNILTYRMA